MRFRLRRWNSRLSKIKIYFWSVLHLYSTTKPFNSLKLVTEMRWESSVIRICRVSPIDLSSWLNEMVEVETRMTKIIFSWSHSWAVFHCVFRLLMCWFLPSLIILISNCALMLFLRRRYNNGKNNRISGERSKKRKLT